MPTIGDYRQYVTLEEPGASVPDGYGGYTEGWAPLDPPDWWCEIVPATARDLEQLAAGTVISQATFIVSGWYHPGITTKTRLLHEGRTLNVVKVTNRDEREIESNLVCAEVVV